MTEQEYPYIAVNMSESFRVLKGYDLTEDERTNVLVLLAGYCGVIDQCNLCGFGVTEFDAIQDLFRVSGLSEK